MKDSWNFEWRFKGIMVAFGFCEWRLHYHQEGRGGGTLGACSPPWAGCPPSPIKGGGGDPSHHPIPHSLICPLVGIFLPLLADPVSRVRCLGEALLKIFSTTTTTMS
jgi:hypothetical protein